VRRALCTIALFVAGSAIGFGQRRPFNPDQILDLVVSPPSLPQMSADDRDLRAKMPPPPTNESGVAPKFPFEVTLPPIS
jgi:hypothetical protein